MAYQTNPKFKVRPEHQQIIAEAIQPLDQPTARKYYADLELSSKRYRWDLFWAANRGNTALRETIKDVYQYANDDHIDTVLREVVPGLS